MAIINVKIFLIYINPQKRPTFKNFPPPLCMVFIYIRRLYIYSLNTESRQWLNRQPGVVATLLPVARLRRQQTGIKKMWQLRIFRLLAYSGGNHLPFPARKNNEKLLQSKHCQTTPPFRKESRKKSLLTKEHRYFWREFNFLSDVNTIFNTLILVFFFFL